MKGDDMLRNLTISVCILSVILLLAPTIRAQNISALINFPIEHFAFESAPYVEDNGDTVQFNLNVYYHIPENPIGIIYFFHGSGGAAYLWFAGTRVEQPLLMREAVRRGFGVVTMESNNRRGKVWTYSTEADSGESVVQNNVDTENIWRVHADSMLAKNRYNADVPLFALGFSDGGAFTNMLALRASTYYRSHQDSIPDVSHIMPFQAAALYGAVGRFTKSRAYDVPTIFNLGINDNKAPAYPDMMNHPAWPYPPEFCVQASHNVLVERGVDTEFNVKAEETLKRYRFIRIPGIDSTDSRVIYDSLKAARNDNGDPLISDDDSLLFNPKRKSVRSVLPQKYKDYTPQIDEQLVAVYSEHLPLSDYKNNILDFFEAHLTVSDVAQSTKEPLPRYFSLEQNYPNPFNPTTTIKYYLNESGNIDLKIYNTLGKRIRTLVHAKRSAGSHKTVWDGRDDTGNPVPGGQYFVKLQAGNSVSSRKLLLLK